MSVSGEAFAREAGRIWDDQDHIAMEQFSARGMQIKEADAGFQAVVAKRLNNMRKEWLAKASAKGLDGEAILKYVKNEVANYKK
jgi:hypothetical protein